MNNAETDFATFKERQELICSIRALLIDYTTPQKTIDKFLTMVKNEAEQLKRHDVLESLQFAGLVYG